MTSTTLYRDENEISAARQIAVARAVQATRDAGLKLAGACIAMLAAAGLLAQWPETAPQSQAPSPAAPLAVWVDMARPTKVYALSAPQLAQEKFTYEARRLSAGGGREDSLTFGDFASKKMFLRLSVYRHGEEMAGDAPFFVEMARRAAPLGLSIAHANVEQDQPTRFGDLETSALTLSGASFTRENCRGFRLIQASPGLTIAGLACADQPMSAADLACMVNRLDLLAAGDDRPLRDFFGAAQAHDIPTCAPVLEGEARDHKLPPAILAKNLSRRAARR